MSRVSSLVRLLILASAVVALLMVPTVAGAISAPIFSPWTSGGAVSEPATLTGYVRTVTGSPIPNVLVEISGTTVSTNIQAQSFNQKALTDVDGKFVITDVIEGTYSMYINQPYNNEYVEDYAELTPWHEDWGDGSDTTKYISGGTSPNVGDFVLPTNGTVSGRAMNGGTPVAGSVVTAQVTTGSVTYTRWATTGADGYFVIPDAPPGDWSVQFTGSGSSIPIDAVPNNSWSAPGDPLTVSPDIQFTLAEDRSKTDLNCAFETGCSLEMSTKESLGGVDYPVGTIGITLTPPCAEGEEPNPYYLYTGDDGWLRGSYLPVGDYHVDISDTYGAYENVSIEATLPARLFSTYMPISLTPAAGTFVVKGIVNGEDDSQPYDIWVEAFRKDGTYLDYVRRAASEPTSGKYLMRLPVDTGYTGDKYRIELEEQVAGVGVTPEHVQYAFDAYGPADMTRSPIVAVGGTIEGTVHDEAGNPVPGVSVAAWYKGTDGWTGDDTAWTRTAGDGTYEIRGLPARSDYKVLFQPSYDPGMPLPEKYKDYYRRVYKGRPIVDSLVTSTSPVTADHQPVAVGLNQVKSGIDETITPGGYVALHTDGPEYPTGAVYCDVMYQVNGKWCEVDSGFTTGGTFQKLWKVLPVGHYRLDYSDYFGRGGGSWEFDLAAGENKYASALVPAPIVYESDVPTTTTGAFVGTVGANGLDAGGTGDVVLYIDKLDSAPTSAPVLSSNYTSMGAVYDFTAEGTTTAGIWTLTLPYNPSVPDANVPNLRIRHFKADGSTEMLMPLSWNLVEHTVKVQTTSLSPFQVLYARVPVTLGTPVAPSRAKAYRSFTVYGTLKPRHTSGAHSVQLKVYRYSGGKYRYYKTFSTTNSNYYSYTKYKGSVKLRSGKYRIYAYAPYDGWHRETRTTKYDSITIY